MRWAFQEKEEEENRAQECDTICKTPYSMAEAPRMVIGELAGGNRNPLSALQDKPCFLLDYVRMSCEVLKVEHFTTSRLRCP